MKYDVVRAKEINEYLVKKNRIICENLMRKCDLHIFLHELLDFFLYNDLSLTKQKRHIRDLNERIENDIEIFSVKSFIEFFDLVHY